MKHINLSSWRGSITDWTKLNYIKGGLPDYYADIANVKGNYCYIENGVYKIEKNINRAYLATKTWTQATAFSSELLRYNSNLYLPASNCITDSNLNYNNGGSPTGVVNEVFIHTQQLYLIIASDSELNTVAKLINFFTEKNAYIDYAISTPEIIIVP